jgi:aminoglycoside phosphotransferase (APT) family kinase protein
MGASATVRFLNEPKLSTYDVDSENNQRRLALVGPVGRFVQSHPLFVGREVCVSFATTGVSSLVAILQAGDEKAVLKIPLGGNPPESEARFLRAWADAGVAVPHVLETGTLAERPYLLMRHIDAPLLVKRGADSLVGDGSFREMGRTLRQMHTPAASGYGRVRDGAPEHSSFREWVAASDFRRKVEKIRVEGLLDSSAHGRIEDAVELLAARCESDPRVSYCHNDLSPANIFDTQPMTVFDPDPIIGHGFIDLGRAMIISVSLEPTGEAVDELAAGYYGPGEGVDAHTHHASLLFNAYRKFSYWSMTGQELRMQRVRSYLAAAKSALG